MKAEITSWAKVRERDLVLTTKGSFSSIDTVMKAEDAHTPGMLSITLMRGFDEVEALVHRDTLVAVINSFEEPEEK